MKAKNIGLALAAIAIAACDDNTSTLGLYPESDGISTSYSIFDVYTRSLAQDSVLGNNTKCYLGQVTDPETGTVIKADFLAQFHTQESYELPAFENMVKNETGEIEADSVEVRLYFESYYGDAENPMKMDVYELDTTNVIREDSSYYSNVNLDFYRIPGKAPIARKVFAATDYTVSEAVSGSSSYYPNIRVILPKEYGTFILRKYYENPQFFANSYNFIRHVCPGFYFKLTGGNGTMIYMDVSTLNVYFRYKDGNEEVSGMSRFAATPEVIQSNRFENKNLEGLLNETSCTYLKTPAGICTEIQLPIDNIYEGHSNDSVSRAEITLTRYNSTDQSQYALGAPSKLLLVRKKDMYSFFEEEKVSDSRTTYTTSFDETYNTYTFSNISRLISYCHNEKITEAAKANLSPEEWADQHPDWDKVVLIPVTITTNSSNQEVSVTHDMSMHSTRLVGGDTKLRMQVIYSRFSN